MEKILIEKTIFVRDKYGVKRQAFLAGEEVDARTYFAVLSKNAVINTDDLPKIENPKEKLKYSLAATAPVQKPVEKKVLETKVLDPEVVVREELPEEVEAEVKEIEEVKTPDAKETPAPVKRKKKEESE